MQRLVRSACDTVQQDEYSLHWARPHGQRQTGPEGARANLNSMRACVHACVHACVCACLSRQVKCIAHFLVGRLRKPAGNTLLGSLPTTNK